jgi:hypothetical protein
MGAAQSAARVWLGDGKGRVVAWTMGAQGRRVKYDALALEQEPQDSSAFDMVIK